MAWVIQNYEHTWNKSQTKWTSRHFTFEIHLDKFDLRKDGFETQNPYCCVIIIIYGEIPFHSVGNILKPVKRGGEGEIHGEQNSRIFFVGRHLTPLAPLPSLHPCPHVDNHTYCEHCPRGRGHLFGRARRYTRHYPFYNVFAA